MRVRMSWWEGFEVRGEGRDGDGKCVFLKIDDASRFAFIS